MPNKLIAPMGKMFSQNLSLLEWVIVKFFELPPLGTSTLDEACSEEGTTLGNGSN
jgi:hypothetical protein